MFSINLLPARHLGKISYLSGVIKMVLFLSLTFTAGMNVPYTYPPLASKDSFSILFEQSGKWRFWPPFFNQFMIFRATTAGTTAIYNASRTLHALAVIPGAWPGWAQGLRLRLAKTKFGVPLISVITCSIVGLIGFVAPNPHSTEVLLPLHPPLSSSSDVLTDFSPQTLARMVRTCVIGVLVTCGLVSASYIQFYKKLRLAAEVKDGTIDAAAVDLTLYTRDEDRFTYKSRRELVAYFVAPACALIVLFNGWATLMPPGARVVEVDDLLGCYIPVIRVPS